VKPAVVQKRPRFCFHTSLAGQRQSDLASVGLIDRVHG
jgi:hypothetical protein